ncbi:MAG: hypothetical protein KKH93_05790 [Candidatus Omnitrophica bacterium]|nr:hypothetical protein [Candidatus Omnitrophota bacterium]MBU2044952.1 hypothetical protein [Candidatus Omnitrophota bacterium]MBU2250807.1 hypothetical protein [Candidatus Omnitrophota bacterium]MBU2265917.1 hypothetical protein [Candidatus Omnitrophota bacterium]MBU2473542.1 hypothetical protein [Candidatus Omnitrophota bacterium]
MLKIFSNKKAQAMVEMAILGPLVLVALGMIVTYVAKVNNDQYALMQAFRYALSRSHRENKIVGYGTWDDRRMSDATNPISGRKTTSSGAGYVLWCIPSVENKGKDPEAKLYVDINRFPEYDITQEGSGSIEPRYFTETVMTVSASESSGQKHGAVGEQMIYKIGKSKRVVQARGHGR